MSLRDVLAELTVKVDITQLEAADRVIDSAIAKLQTLSGLMANLKFPKGVGGSGPKEPGVSVPTLPAGDLETKLAERNARVVALLGDMSAAATPKIQAMQDMVQKAATRLVDLNTKVDNNRALQAAFQARMAESSKVAAQLGPKLAALQAREFELVKSAKAASEAFQAQKEKLQDLGAGAEVVAPKLTMFQRIMAKFGSATSRMADGQLDPSKGMAGNLKQAAQEGDGLFAVLGRLRKMWGLFQFGTAFVAGTLGLKGLVDEMDSASKSAASLGMNIEDFQVLSKFANLAGVATEQLSNIYLQLARNVRLAGDGGKVQQRAFKSLQVETKEANGEFKNTVDIMFETFDALSKVTDNTDKLAMAQQLMGKEAIKLLPAFAAGKQGAMEQLKILRELAVAYDQEAASAAEAFNDTMDLTIHQLRSVALQAVSQALPAILKLVQMFLKVTTTIKDTIRQSSLVQASFAQLGMLLGGMFLLKLFAVTRGANFLASVLLRLSAIALRFVLPLLLLDDVITFLRGGDSLLGRWLEKFKPGGKDAKAWLDIMLRGLAKVKEALSLAVGAFRAFIRGAFGEPVDPADQIKAERFEVLFKEIATKAADALQVIIGRAIEILQEKGYGLGHALLLGLGIFVAKAPELSGRIALTLLKLLLPQVFRVGATMAGSLGTGFLSAIGAFLASPIGLIILAFAAAAGLIYLLFTEKGRAILGAFGEILVTIVRYVIEIAAAIGGKIGEALEGLFATGKEAFDGIKTAAIEFVDWVSDAISNFSWSGFFSGAWEGLGLLKDALGSLFDGGDEQSAIKYGASGSRLRDSDIAAIQAAGGRVGNITNIDQRVQQNTFSGATPAAAKSGMAQASSWYENQSYLNAQEIP